MCLATCALEQVHKNPTFTQQTTKLPTKREYSKQNFELTFWQRRKKTTENLCVSEFDGVSIAKTVYALCVSEKRPNARPIRINHKQPKNKKFSRKNQFRTENVHRKSMKS